MTVLILPIFGSIFEASHNDMGTYRTISTSHICETASIYAKPSSNSMYGDRLNTIRERENFNIPITNGN
jgi:hypothetical protein